MVRGLRGVNRIDRNLRVAVCTVLEAHRHRKARSEFAVYLAFGLCARRSRPS
jgi:hypothetical protein